MSAFSASSRSAGRAIATVARRGAATTSRTTLYVATLLLGACWLLTPEPVHAAAPAVGSAGGVLAAALPTARALAPALTRPKPPEPAVAKDAPASAPAAERYVEGRIKPGETLSKALASHGISSGATALIQRHMKPHFDFRRARVGHVYRAGLDAQGALRSFHYRVSPTEHYWLEAEGGKWRAWREEAVVRRVKRKLSGQVATTLHDAILDLGVGEHERLAQDFAGIFAWDVDFSRGVQPGDQFQILYEGTFASQSKGRERNLGPGRILAAHYHGAGGELAAIYFETEPGRGGYYRPDGTSVQGRFLAAPLNYSRITSDFSLARFHPILRKTRPHFGIDYAAPTGTPIWSVANGVVSHVGWMRGYGRLVKVRHANGYESYYSHMSRFAPGVKVGQTVRQKQVLGFVGASGLATGPHVCFRMTKDGRFVDPSRVRIGNGDRIPKRQMASFKAVRDRRLSELGPAPIIATDEAM